jgi:hypothetical protein
MGWKTDLAGDLIGFTAAEKFLGMASKSARHGVSLPFIPERVFKKRVVDAAGRATYTKGFRTGGWMKAGTMAERSSLRMYEKAGIFGYSGAQKAAAARFSSKIASNTGMRYLLGRGAGIALKGANFMFGATMAYELASTAYSIGSELDTKYKGLELGGHFMDTQGAATSRQRALQAITASSLQARSAIGNEAMLMHR